MTDMMKGTRFKCRRRRGFSLVELLASVLILSLALVSLGQLYVAAMWTTQKARYLSLATKRAEYELEKVRNLGILSLANGPTESSYPTTEYTHAANLKGVSFQEVGLPSGIGTVSWSNYPPNVAGNDYQLKVDVVITWAGAHQSRSRVAVTSLVTNMR